MPFHPFVIPSEARNLVAGGRPTAGSANDTNLEVKQRDSSPLRLAQNDSAEE
jgi:hypothetical protein